MKITEVKVGQLIELTNYDARYRVKVVEAKRNFIRGEYRVLAANGIACDMEVHSGVGMFDNRAPHKITDIVLAIVKDL